MDSLKLRVVQWLRLYVSRVSVWLYRYEYRWLKEAEAYHAQNVLAEFGPYVDWAWIERQKTPFGSIHTVSWTMPKADKERCQRAQQDREAYINASTT